MPRPAIASPAMPADPDSAAPPVLIDRLVLLDPEPVAFQRLAAAVLAAVPDDDPAGRLLAELMLLAAGRLRRAALSEPKDAIPDLAWCRYHGLAERNFRAALKEWQRHRDRLADAPSGVDAPSSDAPSPASPEPAPPALAESTAREVVEAAAGWRSRIALVRGVSDEWPILTRLRLEVDEILGWLADGRTEAELFSRYPGLTPADLAACLACDAEGLCGPFDPATSPLPPGLPVLDHLPDDP